MQQPVCGHQGGRLNKLMYDALQRVPTENHQCYHALLFLHSWNLLSGAADGRIAHAEQNSRQLPHFPCGECKGSAIAVEV